MMKLTLLAFCLLNLISNSHGAKRELSANSVGTNCIDSTTTYDCSREFAFADDRVGCNKNLAIAGPNIGPYCSNRNSNSSIPSDYALCQTYSRGGTQERTIKFEKKIEFELQAEDNNEVCVFKIYFEDEFQAKDNEYFEDEFQAKDNEYFEDNRDPKEEGVFDFTINGETFSNSDFAIYYENESNTLDYVSSMTCPTTMTIQLDSPAYSLYIVINESYYIREDSFTVELLYDGEAGSIVGGIFGVCGLGIICLVVGYYTSTKSTRRKALVITEISIEG